VISSNIFVASTGVPLMAAIASPAWRPNSAAGVGTWRVWLSETFTALVA
jgi:hypothetical protein